MNRAQRRAASKNMQNGQPKELRQLPREQWPDVSYMTQQPSEVWRSKGFLVQVFPVIPHRAPNERLTVCRAALAEGGAWAQNITWDELMECKRQVGRGDQCAVELYPRDGDIVNVANMRHLFILPEIPPYCWVGGSA